LLASLVVLEQPRQSPVMEARVISLLSIWHIKAPLEDVYAAVRDLLRWPDWWPGVRAVALVKAGDGNGIDSVWHASWQGQLPWVYSECTPRIERLVAIEGTARGDLEGIGRWHFSRQDAVSIVRCEWHVRSTRWWMNLIAPVARSMFIRNHARVMAQGGAGLARLLRSSLVGQETLDLMAKTVPPKAAFGRRRERGRIDPAMALVAGIGAGVIATLAQLALWWLADMPLPETLFRDARLTAALAMGTDVLPPPSTPQWDILLVATLIRFILSVAYALIPRIRLRTDRLLCRRPYGRPLRDQSVRLYPAIPWFAMTRDWVPAAHLVFGVALARMPAVFGEV
jgi:hypothetical protein